MGAAVAAIIVRRQKQIVAEYQRAGATSPETARSASDVGVDEDRIFNGLVRRAVLREAGPGRYYFDEPSWTALRGIRRRLAAVILAVVVLLGLLVWAGSVRLH